jgi:hypothetical protein
MFQDLLKSVPKKKSKIYPLEVRGVKGSIISFIKTGFWSIRALNIGYEVERVLGAHECF